jgi:transposase
MRIIGADACKGRLVYCVLDSDNMPKDFQLYSLDGDNFYEAHSSAHGLNQLLAHKPDVIAIEPTGVNYTRLWVRKMSQAGIKVMLIGHTQLRSYRKNLELPDKDDPSDALAIAAYCAEHYAKPQKFVLIRDEVTARLRETALRLGHLCRLQSPLINRLKQDLAYGFPERADSSTNSPLFWRWIAGTGKSLRYDRELDGSIGSGITLEMQFEARLLVQVQAEERRVEYELRSILDDSQFAIYRQVMKEYGIGERAQAMIISQIYPLENFLDEHKQPIVVTSRGKKSGLPTKKHLSLRKVCKMLGIAPTREQSGKSATVTNKAGSELCRNSLWLWSFTRIESSRARINTSVGRSIYEIFLDYKTHKPIKLARAKTIGKAVRMLFYDLVNAINETTD